MTPRTQQERRDATRGALLAAARAAFADQGYAATSTTAVIEAAGVSRGALYHHFEDKADLFAAVYEQIEVELTTQLATLVAAAGSPSEALHIGIDAYLDAATDPAVARIAVLDAPSALGYARWQQFHEQYGLGLTRAALGAAQEAGELRDLPLEPLAHVLLGALRDAALLIVRAEDPGAMRDEVAVALHGLLDGLAA